MRILVQKFGGSSVDTPEKRANVVSKVREGIEEGFSVVVVVSAMGRKGSPYATDTMLSLLEPSGTVVAAEKDLLLACGEIISSVVMAHELRLSGVASRALTGAQAGIITDDSFGDAHILKIRPERVLKLLEEGSTVVVAGFQGGTQDGALTTLGRGGSDITAAALGCALAAERVEIFTDVDGIMTADPRVVPRATKVDRMTYREVCEMAHLGAKVIHPRAAEIAMEGGVALWIKNTFSSDEGTLIADRARIAEGVPIKGDSIISGITHITDLAQVKVLTSNMTAVARLAVLKELADQGISLDLINVSPNEMLFTIKEAQAKTAQALFDQREVSVEIREGFAKVSAVGAGMRGVPGVMASIVEALTEAGIAIYQTADSHTSISCLVERDKLSEAACALHDRFGLSD